jgi:hypothetical protein
MNLEQRTQMLMVPLNQRFVPWSLPPGVPHYSAQRDPYDVKTWGPACGRGMSYATTGAPVAAGTKAVVRKISTGRKQYRGMASDGYDAVQARPEAGR